VAQVKSGGRTGGRGNVRLEERWRPSRHLTAAGALGFTGARPLDGLGAVGGTAGSLSFTWDATHDGRTAVRARANSATVPGLLTADCAGCARATRVEEAALGFERELGLNVVGGVELLGRRAAVDGAVEREALVALHAGVRRQGYKLSALYQGRVSPTASSELLVLAGVGLTRWLSAGALAIYAPRATWLPLFEEPGLPLVPAPGGGAWLLGLQLRAAVGNLVGLPADLWLDALNLTNDRGVLATGSTPIRTPPLQVRAGFRLDY
jgi:hypothetical protein